METSGQRFGAIPVVESFRRITDDLFYLVYRLPHKEIDRLLSNLMTDDPGRITTSNSVAALVNEFPCSQGFETCIVGYVGENAQAVGLETRALSLVG